MLKAIKREIEECYELARGCAEKAKAEADAQRRQEFLDMEKGSVPWQRLLAEPRVTRQTLAEADHTFSRRIWRDQVAAWTGSWVKSW